MDDTVFEVEGWDEFVENFLKLADKWEEKKAILLKRMGNIYHAEVIPLVPVDTSRLVDSFFVFDGGVTDDYIEVGTNVKYALYVNDGHVQHKRFLPASKLSVGGKKKYLKNKNQKGIMLKERYVAGAHFMEKGMNNAKPRIYNAINSWMEEIAREVEGGKL